MAKYAAAIDQGTTSTRCMIFDHGGQVVSVAQKEHEQIYPKPGWVEHDANEIWARTQEVVDEAVQSAGASADDISGVQPAHFKCGFAELSAGLSVLVRGDLLGRGAEHGLNQLVFVNPSGFEHGHIAPVAQDGGPIADAHDLCQPVGNQHRRPPLRLPFP